MLSISAARSDSAAAISLLVFEPQTTMPPSKAETAAAMSPKHPRQKDSPGRYGNSGGQYEFTAALNLGSNLFDALLKTYDPVVGLRSS
jgi:hypothetical protein